MGHNWTAPLAVYREAGSGEAVGIISLRTPVLMDSFLQIYDNKFINYEKVFFLKRRVHL